LLFVVAHILADIMKRLGPATFINELISVSTRPARRSHLLEALVRIDVIMAATLYRPRTDLGILRGVDA